jgi:UDP-GlcNAc:undecaprenyl-phosphate/decaprenyl-phosphate GlcNAc-1-phosphate transferase
MPQLLIAAIASLIISICVIALFPRLLTLSGVDRQTPQRMHVRKVPRAGGLGIFFGMAASATLLYLRFPDQGLFCAALLLAAVPVFFAGFTEDVTGRVGPLVRLAATMMGATIAIWSAGGIVSRVDIPLIDSLIGASPVAAGLLSIIAVAAITNATNMIDGFNGLASTVTAMMALSIAYVAFQVGDVALMTVALSLVGAIAGFFLLNFPLGLIFLGDGGAYLIGFLVAELAVLLVARNPSVSAWYAFLLLIYPISEMLFTVYRRTLLRKGHAMKPDASHLHSLLFRRVVLRMFDAPPRSGHAMLNALTAPYLWILTALAVIPATLLWSQTAVLICLSFLFFGTYVWLYLRIVRFRTPRWMRLKVPIEDPAQID